MTSLSERRYDLDWLRVLGVLLLIPFHVALIFVYHHVHQRFSQQPSTG